jgi:cytochrome b561
MGVKGNSARYGSVAIALHWISAVAIIIMLGTGFAAALAAEPQKAAILRIHVPLGVTVLILTLVRIAWRFFDIRPANPVGQPRWQAVAAYGVHSLLYLAIAAIAASGIGLLVLSGAAPVLFFATSGPLPNFSAFTPMTVHTILAFVLIALVGGHFGTVLYHQFVRRDRLASRMGIGEV